MSNKRTGKMPPSHPEKVAERSDGMCEGCQRKAATNLHHRRFLGRGGKHNLANLVALCGSGNHSGCHGKAHGSAAPLGWAISQHDRRPESAVLFQDLDGVLWEFNDDGTKERSREIPF